MTTVIGFLIGVAANFTAIDRLVRYVSDAQMARAEAVVVCLYVAEMTHSETDWILCGQNMGKPIGFHHPEYSCVFETATLKLKQVWEILEILLVGQNKIPTRKWFLNKWNVNSDLPQTCFGPVLLILYSPTVIGVKFLFVISTLSQS